MMHTGTHDSRNRVVATGHVCTCRYIYLTTFSKLPEYLPVSIIQKWAGLAAIEFDVKL